MHFRTFYEPEIATKTIIFETTHTLQSNSIRKASNASTPLLTHGHDSDCISKIEFEIKIQIEIQIQKESPRGSFQSGRCRGEDQRK